MTPVIRFPLVLMLVCVVTAGALSITYVVTAPRIAGRSQERVSEALRHVCPSGAMEFREVWFEQASSPIYEALDAQGNVVGYAAIGRRHGYSSELVVLAGVYPDYRIAAIRVLEAQETPGLGQRVQEAERTQTLWSAVFHFQDAAAPEQDAEPWFPKQFRNKVPEQLVVETLARPGETKNIAAISGATITSKAVVEAVAQAIELVREYRRQHEEGEQAADAQ